MLDLLNQNLLFNKVYRWFVYLHKIMKFEKPCFINSFLGGWKKVLQIWLLCCNFGFWVFWRFSLNTGICIWAFENYNLTTLNKHSVLTAPLFSPYASPAKPIKENGEAANLYACCLSSTEKGHVLLRAESILRSLACIPWEEPVQVIGMDKGETSSAHGSSGRASVYLAEGGGGDGWREKRVPQLQLLAKWMMSLWVKLLLFPSHHSRLNQTLEYCSFTSNPSIFLQLKNNENSERESET